MNQRLVDAAFFILPALIAFIAVCFFWGRRDVYL
jgi:hypothetical protein